MTPLRHLNNIFLMVFDFGRNWAISPTKSRADMNPLDYHGVGHAREVKNQRNQENIQNYDSTFATYLWVVYSLLLAVTCGLISWQ